MSRYSVALNVLLILLVDAVVFALSLYFYTLYNVNANNSISDERVKEIQKLRSELNDAFEKHEEAEVAKQNVIVQPSWTQAAGKNVKANHKVVATKQGLKEAQKLRDEIKKAVKDDVYTKNVSGKVGGDSKVIKKLHQQYDNSKSQARTQDEILGGVATENADGLGPNVVESGFADSEFDIRKLHRLQMSKRRAREVLVLKSIEEDFSFNLGEDIEAWAHMLHHGDEYFIGRRLLDLQIIRKDAAKYEKAEILTVGKPISDLETYTFWNNEQQKQEGIILVSTDNRVLWYRRNNETETIELYWEWVVGNTISGLKRFAVDSKEYLVVSSNESSRVGYFALNIYQFELHAKEFWITQRLQLKFPCAEVSFLDSGRDLILAITQNDTAAIYTFNPSAEDSAHLHFQLSSSIKSEGIQYISAFKMGGRSYLALGGMQPQILLYQQGKFIPKTIFGNNFGLVELFFPIPVRTYRDDLLLLVQHRVDFSSHNVTVLEALIWDGEAFEISIPAPCYIGQHTIYGAGCMLDIQRDAGLKGATLLRRGDDVYIIVPRHQAESGLFRLHTELLGKNSELLDLQEIFQFLKNWVKQQDNLIAQAQKFLATPSAPIDMDPRRGPMVLDTLKTPELYFNGEINEIYVNDYKWTNADSQMNLEQLIDEIEFLGNDFWQRRPRRSAISELEENTGIPTFDLLEVDEVEAKELIVKNVNGERFYIQNGSLEFDGIMNIANLLVLNDSPSRVTRQSVEKLDQLEVTGNLEFDEINGQPWSEIRDNLVFRNEPVVLDNLDVEGEVIAEDSFNMETLNELNFPDDFLWANGPQSSVVTAEKEFTGTLSANAVDTDGLINGVNPLDAITLTDPQNWTGLPTFAHLEISEKLELNGSASGLGLSNFPRNPTLQESKNITAQCDFANLQVLGPVILQDDRFEGKSLSEMVEDLIQRPQDTTEEIIVPSEKTFNSVEFPVDFHIASDKINDIRLDDFITLNTKQDLNLSVLNSHAYFDDLRVNGTFDGINITDLAQNTIKVDEPLVDLKTHFNFANEIKAADSVNVVETLNGIPITKGYQTLDEDLTLDEAEFENLKSKKVETAGDIEGNGKLNGISLKEFLKERSWSSPNNETESDLDANLYLNELILDDGLETEKLYGIDAQYILRFLKEIDELPEMIIDGKIQVESIYVTGNVQINKLNDLRFDEDIQMTAIWLDRSNYMNTNLTFAQPLMIQGDIIVDGDYNGQNFPDLINDIVFRSDAETMHLITAPKKFKGLVRVSQNTHAKALNGVPMEFIANKRSMGSFGGTLRINGNLIVDELIVDGNLNEYCMSDLSDRLRYDAETQNFVLLGNISLPNPLYLEDLTVYGDLNEIQDLGNFFDNLVYKNGEDQMLLGTYNFTGRVQIENGAHIEYLNGLNLENLFNDIVLINEAMPAIVESPVIFTNAVKASVLNVQESLKTSNVNGCSLTAWQEDTLMLNRPQTIEKFLRFGPGTLDGNKLYASYLNDIDLSKIITLNTEQNLSVPLNFSEIYLNGPLNVKGPVNEVDFEKEFANTVMVNDGDQYIKTPVILETATVLGNLESRAKINNTMLDLNNVARLYDDIVFESPIYFQELNVNNIHVEALMSNINITDWYEKALWLQGKPTQSITGSWTVRSLHLKSGPEIPTYTLDNERVTREDKSLEELYAKYAKLIAKQAKRPYVLKYLHKSTLHLPIIMEDDSKIRKAFHIQQFGKNYLLISSGCWTKVFRWMKEEMNFKLIGEFELGEFEDLVQIPASDHQSIELEFLTNSRSTLQSNCSIKGLNLWSIFQTKLLHLNNFGFNISAVQVGLEPNTFYIVDAGELKEIRMTTTNGYKTKNLFDAAMNFTGFYFLPNPSDSFIALANGSQVVEISSANQGESSRQKRSEPERFSLAGLLPRAANDFEVPVGESILKPNISVSRHLSFRDFKPLLEVILIDLNNRLNIEVNITQLSIPETDLIDEHLIQDFIDIMAELQSQQIYPSDFFEGIDVKSLNLPDNPGQVLAARAVHIVWPVIVEIVEIHSYLRYNETVEHPTLRCIINNLGWVIHDVLHLANVKSRNASDAAPVSKEEALMVVIERIRKFQTDLHAIIEELQLEIYEDRPILNSLKGPSAFEGIDNKIEITETFTTISNLTLRLYENKEFPSTKDDGEILRLIVGPHKRPRNLFAVAKNHIKLVPNHHAGIIVYSSLHHKHVFQTISGNNPRSLVTLRIRDLTLLAFIEDCCVVRILQYQGIQGFVEFSTFQTKTEIVDLLMVPLPTDDMQGKRFYLVTVLSNKLVFYEFMLTGFRELPNIGRDLDCSDC